MAKAGGFYGPTPMHYRSGANRSFSLSWMR
jgi:hypothetical protein